MRNPLRKITKYYSPLQIRPSLLRIRQCPHPWSAFFLLVWPVPWVYSLPYPLPSVKDMENSPNLWDERQSGIRKLHNIPIYRFRDTPLRSLYRLFEDLCTRDYIMMGYECEYFFFHSEARWSLVSIPDPQDADPIRYAIIASFLEALVDAFNWRLELGIRRDNTLDKSEHRGSNFVREEAPSWTSRVGALEERLDFIKIGPNGVDLTEESNFLKRNIRAPNGYLYTV
jgi:hypothetical protein